MSLEHTTIRSQNLKDRFRSIVPKPMWIMLRDARDLAIRMSDLASYPYQQQVIVGGLNFYIEIDSLNHRRRTAILEAERKHIEEMIQTITPTSVCVDVGANIGTHTIPMAIAAHHGWVYAIEPDPEIAEASKRNTAINYLKNVTVLPIALWDTNDEILLHTDGIDGAAPVVSSVKASHQNKFKHQRPGWGYRLDTLVDNGLIPMPDVVKIDVEGSELKVLDGMGTSVRPDHIFIEIHGKSFGLDPEIVHRRLTDEMNYSLKYAWGRSEEILCHYERNSPITFG